VPTIERSTFSEGKGEKKKRRGGKEKGKGHRDLAPPWVAVFLRSTTTFNEKRKKKRRRGRGKKRIASRRGIEFFKAGSRASEY